MAGPLTSVMPAARAMLAVPSTPSWVLGQQCRGLSCMAGPLTGVMPAARAKPRQLGWTQHPILGALSRRRCLGSWVAVNHDLPCPGSGVP
jgi:hypothetical protein